MHQSSGRHTNEKNTLADSSRFSKIILAALILATILSAALSKFTDTYIFFNDNQLLYLFSAMAQVIGGVFGLTLTTYVFFVDKFKESARDDATYYDATVALLNRYFHILILIAITCGSTIFFSIIGMLILHNQNIIYPFIINEGVLLFLIGVSAILVFGVMLLDPEKLDKEIAVMKKKAEEYYQNTSGNAPGDLGEFLKIYNMLERLIINFASAYAEEQQYSHHAFRPQIIQSLRSFGINEIINGALSKEINELRMFRNGLVHGVDVTVSQTICTRIKQIYDTLNNAYTVFQEKGRNSDEWRDAINKVYNLSKESTTNQPRPGGGLA